MAITSIQFLGAAGTVTGSKYLVKYGQKNLLVDCGLFQGLKELRLKNWEPFPVAAPLIDAVVLTHAHIDHSGFVPRLIKEGFRGKVYCTAATLDLCRILLPDTGFLQEEEAEYLNRRRISKHHPALPLFTKQDAEASLQNFEAKNFEEEFSPLSGVICRFLPAGHILGAASVVLKVGSESIAFSGDTGRQNDPIFLPPAVLPPVDYLVLESTYGDRLHPNSDPMGELEVIVDETVKKGGVLLIPAFAVGRAQTMLYFLSKLRETRRIPSIPIFLNSPMATKATDLFQKHRELHQLSDMECRKTCQLPRYVESVEESMALNKKSGPMIIISASGMATGGRILHHLRAFGADKRNAIVLSGYQAAGTRGRALQEGAKQIKIHGRMVPIEAKVHFLENFSAHADYSEILRWLSQSKISPKQIFLTHGEPQAAAFLKIQIERKFSWTCHIPKLNEEVSLNE